jgi:hypothetical protein
VSTAFFVEDVEIPPQLATELRRHLREHADVDRALEELREAIGVYRALRDSGDGFFASPKAKAEELSAIAQQASALKTSLEQLSVAASDDLKLRSGRLARGVPWTRLQRLLIRSLGWLSGAAAARAKEAKKRVRVGRHLDEARRYFIGDLITIFPGEPAWGKETRFHSFALAALRAAGVEVQDLEETLRPIVEQYKQYARKTTGEISGKSRQLPR